MPVHEHVHSSIQRGKTKNVYIYIYIYIYIKKCAPYFFLQKKGEKTLLTNLTDTRGPFAASLAISKALVVQLTYLKH